MRQVLIIPDLEDGGYTIEVPSLPGCISEGETIDEALTNIQEAIELYSESLQARGLEVPEDFPPIQVMEV
jgi:predicted RNase H-like HicB family nuclease